MASTCTRTISQSGESSETRTAVTHHSRTISNATSTTMHSQPHERLLRPTTPQSLEYCDARSHASRNSDQVLAIPRWPSRESRQGSLKPSIVERKKSPSQKKPPQRIKVLRRAKNVLEISMAVWSIYNTARYLMAFTIYNSFIGQIASIGLGVCTGLGFAFATCAAILSLLQTRLLMHGIAIKAVISLRATLRYLASFCLFIPGLANLVLVFMWKESPDIELQIKHRCHLDIDLLWSIKYPLCINKSPARGFWITTAIIRLFVTLAIIIAFHFIASSPHFIPVRRPSKLRNAHQKKSSSVLGSYRVPLTGDPYPSVVLPQLNDDLRRGTSESTLSARSSPRNRLRPARSTPTFSSLPSEAPSYNNTNFLPMNSEFPPSDRESGGFVDRFRALISQITREMEEGLAFARSDESSSSQHTVDSSRPKSTEELDIETTPAHNHYEQAPSDDEDDFYTEPDIPTVDLTDYNHQLYSLDDQVRVMNGYIRRMPTIESMGSKEHRNSMAGSSMHTNRDRDRLGTSSRPPTRNTLTSWVGTDLSGSEPRSQSGSLTAQAELLAGMFARNHASEIGELSQARRTVRHVESSGSNFSSGTSGSQDAAQSLHTSSTGSEPNSLTRALAGAFDSPLNTFPVFSPGNSVEESGPAKEETTS